jgi:hypothetical protein
LKPSNSAGGCLYFFHLVRKVRRNQTGGPLREKNASVLRKSG